VIYEKKMNLVQVSASLQPKLGGPHAVVVQTQPYLSNHYNQKLLVYGSSTIKLDKMEINSTFLNNRFGLRFKIPNSVSRRSMNNADILLIHGFYLWSTLLTLYFSKCQDIFLMPHGSLELYQAKKGKFRKKIFTKLVNLLLKDRKIHFLVGSNSEVVSVRHSFPNSKISVIGLGIQISNLAETSSRIHSPIKLFCLSRITNKKRIDLCIRAVSKLNEGNNKFHLSIYGAGDTFLENELNQLVKELNLGEQVSFKGHVDGESKKFAIQSSDILLLPSENENFAVAVAESIAFGKPVVVSKFVAMHEFVDAHSTGLTIDELDVDKLVSAIKEVSDKFSTYQENCIAAANLLAWEDVIKLWIKTIDSNVSVKND
jgi:glycosyltransferase involved in cell wall biosynthesis